MYYKIFGKRTLQKHTYSSISLFEVFSSLRPHKPKPYLGFTIFSNCACGRYLCATSASIGSNTSASGFTGAPASAKSWLTYVSRLRSIGFWSTTVSMSLVFSKSFCASIAGTPCDCFSDGWESVSSKVSRFSYLAAYAEKIVLGNEKCTQTHRQQKNKWIRWLKMVCERRMYNVSIFKLCKKLFYKLNFV